MYFKEWLWSMHVRPDRGAEGVAEALDAVAVDLTMKGEFIFCLLIATFVSKQ